jgi:hypothetical protein
LTGSRRNPAEMGTPMGTPGGATPGCSLDSVRLAAPAERQCPASRGVRRPGSAGYGRGERSRGYAFQLSYVIAPAAALLVDVA